MNPRLRSAIQAARTANMPKDNIERAINKSEVNKNLNYNSIVYEGFGPEKIAIIVEALTDNKNRTASNIRTIFQKIWRQFGRVWCSFIINLSKLVLLELIKTRFQIMIFWN